MITFIRLVRKKIKLFHHLECSGSSVPVLVCRRIHVAFIHFHLSFCIVMDINLPIPDAKQQYLVLGCHTNHNKRSSLSTFHWGPSSYLSECDHKGVSKLLSRYTSLCSTGLVPNQSASGPGAKRHKRQLTDT